jgi:hypothetical protein
MNTEALKALEIAIEPYRANGYMITSQNESSITLVGRSQKFSYLGFLFFLLLLWPVAVLYLISYNHQPDRTVCLRLTSQGGIEASGYTLNMAERARRRRRQDYLIAASMSVLLIGVVIALLLWP